MDSIHDLANRVSRWILNETDEFQKMAYIIARTRDSASLRDYLLPIIKDGTTPAALQLREELTERQMEALASTLLPYGMAWGFVDVDLCAVVGLELRPHEYAALRERLEEREGS